MRARRLSVAAATAALLLLPTACSSGEEDPAVGALCDQFEYDAEAGLGANEDRMREIVESAGGDPASLGQVISGAEDECSGTVEEYLAAAQGTDADAGEASQAPAAEDVEDPQLTTELEARGIDSGAVVRLGAVVDVLGIGSSEKEPISLGAAQRLARDTIERCDAVSSGASTWDAQAAEIAADYDVSEGKGRQLTVYLRNHFCANLG